MRKFKLLISFCLVFLLLVCTSFPAMALEETVEKNQEVNVSVLFTINEDGTVTADTPLSNTAPMVFEQSGKSRVTVPGNVGSVSMRWVNNGQIWWYIYPAYSGHWTFAGTITITNTYNQRLEKTLYISGSGTSSFGDNEFFTLKKGHTYLATLTGGGTFNGKDNWRVGSGVHEVRSVF